MTVSQLETQNEETQNIEIQLESGKFDEDEVATVPLKKKPEKELVMREPGKTLFPMSRVQKIIKADKVHRSASYMLTGYLHYIRKYQLLQRMQLF